MTLPDIGSPLTLQQAIAALEPERVLVFCDEAAEVKDPIAALAQARRGAQKEPLALAVLIGPEGGFAAEERDALLGVPNAVRLSLGPRVSTGASVPIRISCLSPIRTLAPSPPAMPKPLHLRR